MLFPGKKIVYFVRHGQSANNAANVRQGAAGSLSDKGRQQALFVGERFEHVPIETILSSPYERTKETTAIINEKLHRPVEYLDILAERKNPSEIVGKNADSEEVKKIMDIIDRSFHDENFRYSDEENFSDLKGRAHKLLDFLAVRQEKRLLCVSHRIFLKMVFSYINQGEDIDANEFAVLDYNTKVENTAITITEYSWWRKVMGKNPWSILAVNDYGRIDN